MCGEGKLTAILNPYLVFPEGIPSNPSPYLLLSQETDSNYFSARLEASLQDPAGNSLLGPIKKRILPEQDARAKIHKWFPVRHHCGSFNRTISNLSQGTMQLYARVYTRDDYQYEQVDGKRPSLEVAFVLSLSSDSSDGDVYNEMRTALGPQVESAVIDQQLDVER